MLEPGWRNRMGYYRMIIRGHEWIERQRVSLLDVRGLGKGALKLLYKTDLTTARRIMQTPTEEIVRTLAAQEKFMRDDQPSREKVELWKCSIRSLWLRDVGPPLPKGWEGEIDELTR